jgi:hypothetical protein
VHRDRIRSVCHGTHYYPFHCFQLFGITFCEILLYCRHPCHHGGRGRRRDAVARAPPRRHERRPRRPRQYVHAFPVAVHPSLP